MAPLPQEQARIHNGNSPPGADSVVISGVSGLYPQSSNIKEFSEILYNQVNPIQSVRWKTQNPEIPPFSGLIPELDRFDAQFFRVHYRLGNSIDVMCRKILEQTYQAIYDAGVSPEHLNGKKVGVFLGKSFSESEKSAYYDKAAINGFGVSGTSGTMFANRISYWLNVKGPSMVVEDADCSSLLALEQAWLCIARGECDAAIVGACTLCMHAQMALLFGRNILLSEDGTTKSFDENAKGCVRSEAINVLFLQKASDALRIYAEIKHIKCEFLPSGHPTLKATLYRNPEVMTNFLRNFYDAANIPPQAIEYVDAFGIADPVIDKLELDSLADVLCKNRSEPLCVGSVTSNIGYTEGASGIAAITKIILGYEKGEMAGTLHCGSPRRDVAALAAGRMAVAAPRRLRGALAAVNALGLNGTNAHLVLRGHCKPKDLSRYKSPIPYLVTASGRQEAAVHRIFRELQAQPLDPEQLMLLHNIHETRIPGHTSRGFAILEGEGQSTKALKQRVDYFDDARRPLWFVYSGMGSQWAGMGAQLLRIPTFAAAIERCDKVLSPRGLDIVHIISAPDKTIFDNILHSFVGIAAVQIGLTDVLRELGLEPDYIIGHSVGELGCGYADGCFTAEEMILCAYSRGLVSLQTPFVRGSMAAVGLGYQQMKGMVPPEIDVACHNGPESSTISGPADQMREFVAGLTAKGIFAKEVPCSNIAYHSRYIAEAGPKLLEYLSEVVKVPKRRSERWLSTSVPEDRWHEEQAQFCSAWYHTNNLLSSVLFEETARRVPAGAVLVEVAPHGLLQAILKRSLPPDCRHIPLTKRGHSDNVAFLLEAIGSIYMEGFNPKVKSLYPKIDLPVSIGTPHLSHLVEWVHDEKWRVPLITSTADKTAAVCQHMICLHEDDHAYLQGNVVNGKTEYPFSAALVAVWDTLAMTLGRARRGFGVRMRDVALGAPPRLHRRLLPLRVALHRGSGCFEVLDELSTVATGYITVENEKPNIPDDDSQTNEKITLESDEVYELLHERGYSYGGDFRSIIKTTNKFTEADIIWNENWVPAIEAVIQLNLLHHKYEHISQPKHIRSLYIDVKTHNEHIIERGNKKIIIAQRSSTYNYTKCGGILLEHLQFRDIPPLHEDTLTLQQLKFVPHFQSNVFNLVSSLKVFMQIVAENVNADKVQVVEIANSNERSINDINGILSDIPGSNFEYVHVERNEFLQEQKLAVDADVVILKNIAKDNMILQTLCEALGKDKFILNAVEDEESQRILPQELYNVVTAHGTGSKRLELARWKPTNHKKSTAITVNKRSDFAVLTATRAELTEGQSLLVLTTYPAVPGLKDLVRRWRKEAEQNQIYLVMTSESGNWEQFPDLNLAFSVLENCVWGGEYYLRWESSVGVEHEVELQIERPGDLDSLKWVEIAEPMGPGVAVTVRFAGINDLDAKRATGVVPFKNDDYNSFGMDFSGITDSGERVMGAVRRGAASGRLRAEPRLLWPVPAHWTLEDAATVPSAYAQALYCLGVRAALRPGMAVLVHGGAGALGQAAVAAALALRCRVLATVGSLAKKKLLLRLFPQLKCEHVGNSRDTSFGDMVLRATGGKGCDIIISCLRGELKDITLKCAAYCGITFDTVQIPSEENYVYGMYHLTKQRSYVPIDFSSIFDYEEDMKSIQQMVSAGIAAGWVRPLTRLTLGPADAARAMRLAAAAPHCGRLLLRLRDTVLGAQPRVTCSAASCHVVICDEDGLGLRLARRLLRRGAGALRLHTLRPPRLLRHTLQQWQEQGVNVQTSSGDIGGAEAVQQLVLGATALGAGGGVEGVYLVVPRAPPGAAERMDALVKALDLVTRNTCPSLRYFAVLSSMDSIGVQTCQERVKKMFPATVLYLPQSGQVSAAGAGQLAERALRGAGLLRAHAAPRSLPLAARLARLAGTELPPTVRDETPLHALRVDRSALAGLSAYLHHAHNINIDEEQLAHLTVGGLASLETRLREPEWDDAADGLAALLPSVDRDELAAPRLEWLHTLARPLDPRSAEVSGSQWAVVCGGLGGGGPARALARLLRLPALLLRAAEQPPRATAAEHVQILKKKIGLSDNFYIVGLEYGVLVALEMAAILEELGYTGTVFCIGDTPEELQERVEALCASFPSEEVLQDAVALRVCALLAGTAGAARAAAALRGTRGWARKAAAAARALLGGAPTPAQYACACLRAAYAGLQHARSTPRPRALRSRIVALCPARAPASAWQRYSAQPVLQYALPGGPEDPEAAAIVNRHLDPAILADFQRKNLCDTYIIDADSLMCKAKIVD